MTPEAEKALEELRRLDRTCGDCAHRPNRGIRFVACLLRPHPDAYVSSAPEDLACRQFCPDDRPCNSPHAWPPSEKWE